MKKLLLLLSMLAVCQQNYANTGLVDTHIPGFNLLSLQKKYVNKDFTNTTRYTLIPYNYYSVLTQSKNDIKQLIRNNNRRVTPISTNQLVRNVGYYFEHTKHTPYNAVGAMGEGDWCTSNFITPRCQHIQQDPIYRTDSLDCVTLVNIAMGLIGSHNMVEFNKNIFQVAYGANKWSHKYPRNEISYRNRDNFVSGSFNPINQIHHRLIDVTKRGVFSTLVKQTDATITRKKWFYFQAKAEVIASHVRVLKNQNGDVMADKLSDPNNFDAFPSQIATINYIPKNDLVESLSSDPTVYIPIKSRINKIKTPSVVEVVRDVKKWNIGDKNIQDIIGSGINISHIALLYHHRFAYKQIIYQQVRCDYNAEKQKICTVKPISCNQRNGCYEIMMLAATNAYPDGYVWSHTINGQHYYCTSGSNIPAGATPLTTCNRVMTMPLGDYLIRKEYGRYTFMDSSSILGLNIEKILPNNAE